MTGAQHAAPQGSRAAWFGVRVGGRHACRAPPHLCTALAGRRRAPGGGCRPPVGCWQGQARERLQRSPASCVHPIEALVNCIEALVNPVEALSLSRRMPFRRLCASVARPGSAGWPARTRALPLRTSHICTRRPYSRIGRTARQWCRTCFPAGVLQPWVWFRVQGSGFRVQGSGFRA